MARFAEPLQAGYSTVDLIDALSDLTQVYYGPNGLWCPVGFGKQAARKTIAKWVDWLEKNDPGDKK